MAYFLCNGGFKSLINITSTANATVTATTTGATYTAVCDSSGYAQIKVKKKGTYNIASTGTTHIAHATIVDHNSVTATYNWNKYNSLDVYSNYVSGTGQAGPDPDVRVNVIYCSSDYSYVSKNDSYTFNSDNGLFTLTGDVVQFYQMSTNSWSTGFYDFIPNGSSGTNLVRAFCQNGGWGFITQYRNEYFLQGKSANGAAYCYWTIYQSYHSGYRKGATHYGLVTSTLLTQYPDDGRSSGDGYWYVASN